MSISKGYPDPIKLKKYERETLKFLHTQPIISKQFAHLAQQARLLYYELEGAKKLRNMNIDFNAILEINVQGEIKRLYVGANLRSVRQNSRSFKHEMVSYSLALCNSHEPPFELIRKFHFDYAVPGHTVKQELPIFHFQYGGRLSAFLKEHQIDDAKIERRLDVPRLNHHPVTLALLLDIVFREFRSVETHKIIEDSDWRALVRQNEELVVKPYYQRIARFIGSAKYGSDCLIRDYCYGN